jgi:hypothetical protein
MAISTMTTIAATAMMAHVVGLTVVVVVFVVDVVVVDPVAAGLGAWFWVVVDEEFVVSGAVVGSSATMYCIRSLLMRLTYADE